MRSRRPIATGSPPSWNDWNPDVMLELLAGAAVALAVLLFVLDPLVRPAPPPPPEDEEPVPLEESASPKVQALLALSEVEFDRATGKLGDADYAALKGRYQAAALAALDGEEAGAAAAPAPGPADPAEALIAQARRVVPRACPRCGPRPESDAVFCSDCGRPVAA
jgi:hypothetical protein